MCQTIIESLSKVLTNKVNIYPLYLVWLLNQIQSQSTLLSSVTSFWMPKKPFIEEKEHTSNQFYLQNDSP